MKRFILLLGLATLVMCATVGGMKQRKGSGITKTYTYPYEKVFTAAIEAGKLQNLELEEGGRVDQYIVLKKGGSMWSAGELVAIFFTPKDTKTDVEIVSKKRIATNLFAKNWTASFFRAMDMELGVE